MQYFTREEYDNMIQELLHTRPACFDTMLQIAEKTLKPYIRKLCSNSSLRGRQYEDDIMQEIYIRLVKTCVTNFLVRENEQNDNPEEFKAWIFTVAKNIFLDFIRKHREEEELQDGAPEPPELSDLEAVRARLNDTFAAALGIRSDVPKLLAWIAVRIMMLGYVEKQSEAIRVLAEEFSAMTMYELLEWLLLQEKSIPWLEIDRPQITSICERLDKPFDEGRRLGDVPFGETFRDPAMLSDWMYRMDNKIQNKLNPKKQEDKKEKSRKTKEKKLQEEQEDEEENKRN